jgi:hypothetical protein
VGTHIPSLLSDAALYVIAELIARPEFRRDGTRVIGNESPARPVAARASESTWLRDTRVPPSFAATAPILKPSAATRSHRDGSTVIRLAHRVRRRLLL